MKGVPTVNNWTQRQCKFYCKALKGKEYGEKLSRKEKKAYLGYRLSKNKIRKNLTKITFIESTARDDTMILPSDFCPVCGCTEVRWRSYHVAYPERWERGYCARCRQHVWESDNSPYIHILEWIIADKMSIKAACKKF